jgi:hypothetical protein
MCFMCEETQYLCRYISFCLTKLHDNSCNNIRYTDILLYFLLQQQFIDNIIKAGVKVNIFIIYPINLLLLVFELKVVVFLMCLTEILRNFQDKTPLTYTVYMSSQIHHLQYTIYHTT